MTTATEALPSSPPAPSTVPSLARRLGYQFSDGLVITKRNFLVWMRVPAFLIFTLVQPIMFLLMFRYVFAGAIGAGSHLTSYVNYLIPGIIAQSSAFASIGTAIALAEGLKKGSIDRFRSMPMAQSAYLSGRLGADTARTIVTIGVMIGIAYAVGFRFANGPWLALGMCGMAVFFGLVICCIAAFIGLAIKDQETVQSAGLIWLFPITFVSSAFVPVSSMPDWLQKFAQHQPVSQVIDAMRGMAIGGPVWVHLWQSLAWLIGALVIFGPLAVRAYRRA
jgi:ABC-2 type transport system permease protein/oleandomycin transport system permease protein